MGDSREVDPDGVLQFGVQDLAGCVLKVNQMLPVWINLSDKMSRVSCPIFPPLSSNVSPFFPIWISRFSRQLVPEVATLILSVGDDACAVDFK